MSQPQISRSPDLQQLFDEGYDVEVRGAYLLVKQVPYVNSAGKVKRGTLVSTLNLANDKTVEPDTHQVTFAGEYPCRTDGSPIESVRHSSQRKDLGSGIIVDHDFSAHPVAGRQYTDYYKKMSTYASILGKPAAENDPSVTARVYSFTPTTEEQSVFRYLDSASARAEINAVTAKLAGEKVAIVGVGGTGSYVLDLVSKTPVAEIHIIDGDTFAQHNAFRAPGAASSNDLEARQKKVDYLRGRYDAMHRGIIAHGFHIDAGNIHLLKDATFVFLCIDRNEEKKLIVQKLEEWNIPFVEVGMGIQNVDGALCGVIRVTTSSPQLRSHVHDKHRIPFLETDVQNEYARNIQVSDLNALNACLAVIKWKRYRGFYHDLEREHYSAYSIDGNHLLNEDLP